MFNNTLILEYPSLLTDSRDDSSLETHDTATAKPSVMASNGAVYSTETLKEQNAQEYRSMAGKVQQPLLRALEVMGYQ